MGFGITTDFHSHILPAADHGSDCVETSLKQLDIISSHGIKRVVATPHFYPAFDNLDMFLDRRSRSAEALKAALRPGSPDICLGAEVLICDGIYRMEGLEDLAIAGTNSILLEMPFAKWSESLLETVYEIRVQGFNVVIAHIDRYDPKSIDELMELDVYAQLNPDPFLSSRGRRFAMKWLDAGKVVAVGSDLHRADETAYQNFIKACSALDGFAEQVEASMQKLLSGARTLASENGQ